jgi:hypothetical protein
MILAGRHRRWALLGIGRARLGAMMAGLLGLTLALAVSMTVAARADGASTFGIASFALRTSSTQAGAHADLTTEFRLNTTASGEPIGALKDLRVQLPSGFIGNPQAVPKCTLLEFESWNCKPSAQVGGLKLSLYESGPVESLPIPVYNVTPSRGHVATFAVSLLLAKIMFQVDISRDGSYELTTAAHDLTTLLPVVGSALTLWGVPDSPIHDHERDPNELTPPHPIYGEPNAEGEPEIIGYEPTLAGVAPAPFLTNPTDCTVSAQTGTLSVESWESPGEPVTQAATLPPPTGCEALQISPRISVRPDTTQRDTPAGYDINLSYPLSEEPGGLGTPSLRQLTLTLPPGTTLSPGVANGLVGCSDAQFTAEQCPQASKIGTVTVSTPFLSDQLTGSVYLGSPSGSATYRMFVSASADTVVIHMSGVVTPDPVSGQLTVSFRETPPLPFTDLDMKLFGGPGAVLSNPVNCGPASTTAQLLSYGGQTASAAATFAVDADGAGGACSDTLPFSPSVSAGTISSLAGAFSPLSLTVSREDGQRELSSISAQLPPGLLGMLAGVPQCADAQVASDSCPQASRIGSTTIVAGAGSEPLSLGGSVYLTGPYGGAPFGLAIVVPAVAGPFNLGTIVVRAQVRVDPVTLQLQIVSDPLPQILDGIPLRLRVVNLTVDRPGFIVTPTDCIPQQILTSVGSVAGVGASVTDPFQTVGCSGLRFAPKLTVSSEAKASRRGAGASLEVKLANPGSGQANIRSMVVELPSRLRPRLSTVQQACLASTFAQDPSRCPVASVVGTVTIGTPILSSPLTGMVYLIFRGGNAYPELAMVPHGQGVTVRLTGELRISPSNVISAAFRALPDVPINSFDLRLPRGPHSMLGATEGLCSKKLGVPATLTGQNGAQFKSTPMIAVSGCPKPRRAARKLR